MRHSETIPLVTTIKERCRVCYTCVRECPAKAIRIATGQAEVIPERCIGCGNCVRVCSQHAKKVLGAADPVRDLLAGPGPVAALVAPSFPAEFTDCDERHLVGLLRALGFEYVHEVAFGADLVAAQYAELLAGDDGKRYIATTCPAIIGYVEKYYPNLVGSLAPIVSPMVAAARVAHRLHGPDLKTVFIGPCIAKKGEAASQRIPGEVAAALTFTELREMLREAGLAPESVKPSDFDPPRARRGALLPVARGLFHAAEIHEDLIQGQAVAAEGRTNFVDALEEFGTGALDARLLDVLCCNGCIMGAGMSTTLPLFARRSRISQHARQRMEAGEEAAWQADMARFTGLDLGRTFEVNDQRIVVPLADELSEILARMGKFSPEDELNCGACGYDTCRGHAIAIHKGLAESEMCLPHTIDQLKRAVQELAVSNDQLATAQEALMQSEKLASMGQLAAGIAHEVNNPLGVVLMYAHLLLEECDKDSRLYEDLAMIVDQSDRCKKIVAGLLHFARQNKVLLQPTDLGDLVDRSLRALAPPENVTVRVQHDTEDRTAEVDRDQIIQVLTNLVSNAYAAMPAGGALTVRTCGDADLVRLCVTDTGVGIPRENLTRIFDPFFTTKQIGKGTGLGLAVTYGIVKMHRGDIRVESNADPAAGPTGSTFTVTLPRKGREQ
jgi:signal transduction histidine kinase/Fe-S-cluster-containing hydrogenase component 2